MPGTPMNKENNGLTKLQTGNSQNGRDNNEAQHAEHPQCMPEPGVRELTQTDKLNKRLLESLLERMNKSDGEFDKFMDKNQEEPEETEDGEGKSEF